MYISVQGLEMCDIFDSNLPVCAAAAQIEAGTAPL